MKTVTCPVCKSRLTSHEMGKPELSYPPDGAALMCTICGVVLRFRKGEPEPVTADAIDSLPYDEWLNIAHLAIETWKVSIIENHPDRRASLN